MRDFDGAKFPVDEVQLDMPAESRLLQAGEEVAKISPVIGHMIVSYCSQTEPHGLIGCTAPQEEGAGLRANRPPPGEGGVETPSPTC